MKKKIFTLSIEENSETFKTDFYIKSDHLINIHYVVRRGFRLNVDITQSSFRYSMYVQSHSKISRSILNHKRHDFYVEKYNPTMYLNNIGMPISQYKNVEPIFKLKLFKAIV